MPELVLSRRKLLAVSAAIAAGALGSLSTRPASTVEPAGKRRRIAAINSIYRLRSHAYHICGRFIYGYQKEGFHHQPPFQLVRMLNDQTPKDDLGRETCQRHGIELCDSVTAALGGKDKLDV